MSDANNAALEAAKKRMQALYGENRKITDGTLYGSAVFNIQE